MTLQHVDRTEVLRNIPAIAEDVPEKLRARISTEEWQDYWIEAFKTRLKNHERDAVRLYPELLRMVGAEDRRLEIALGALGVSLEIAKQAVGMYRQVEGADRAGQLAMMQEALELAGYTVLAPAQGIEPGGGAAAALSAATIPSGSDEATEGGNGNGSGQAS